MKLEILAILTACMVLPLQAQIKRPERKSLLDSDPSVVYLEPTLGKPLELTVIKEAPVFSGKDGQHRLGTLKAGQTVKLEAITDKIYRVRGEGKNQDGVAGWVAPWAFASKEPDFIAILKKLYERQMQVQALIAEKQVAVGMTLKEVGLSLGTPNKTSVRKTAAGQSGRWEFVIYEEVKNYVTEVDRQTGAVYRRLASVTRQEKSKTAVEFSDDVVTAVEESEDRVGGAVRIVVPPLIFRW
ncbi:MAG: hypothetical protein EOP83_19495 [Verrucomicrobiaceae bacterium]|nr:MAG: hypothetical protein EOP83_19495 [Verrucomicrobiaceae bacterium]